MNFDENLSDFGCGLEDEGSMSKNAAAFLKSYARTSTVFSAVGTADSLDKKQEIVREYLNFCYDSKDGVVQSGRNPVSMSVKGQGFESITTSGPPDIQRDSFTTLYLVEFFTHCCINCIHSIEDVRQVHEELSKKYESSLKQSKTGNGFKGVKVLSVHSPKFPREKDLASIKAFCKRNRMEHSAVVNDPGCILWNEFGVACWPTLLILGPNPDGKGLNLLFNFMGEGHKNDLLLSLNTAMEYFQERLRIDPNILNGNGDVSGSNELSLDYDILNNSDSKSILRFPGKVTVHDDLVVISDSGNDRLVVVRPSGEIMHIVGGSGKGCRDGTFSEAQFFNPQGIAFESDSMFYVADTGNHALRKVDLKSKRVYTFINPGRVIKISEDESETLKSPWDLSFYDHNVLIVAAAGNHRLFGYFFGDVTLFGVDHQEATFTVIAGSGREENRNNSYILKASFAQPSGISTVKGDTEKVLYIADSESSSIRSITAKGQVVAVVGGSRDPTDLFAFGDVDGKGYNVKLQHPMGVCSGSKENPSHIFIADTYNHKVKRIDIATKECITFVSEGLNEPSGICKDPKSDLLYVADTNNHSIKLIDISTGVLSELELFEVKNENVSRTESDSKPLLGSIPPTKVDKIFEVPVPINVSSNPSSLKLNFLFSPLPKAYEGGRWKVLGDTGSSLSIDNCTGSIDKKICSNSDQDQGLFSVSINNFRENSIKEFFILADVFFCGPNSCLKRSRKIKVVLVQDQDTADSAACLNNLSESKTDERTLQWENMNWNN